MKNDPSEGHLVSPARVAADVKESEAPYAQVIKANRGAKVKNVIQAIITGEITGDLQIGNIVYERSKLDKLDEYLALAVTGYEARLYQLGARLYDLPTEPYKFLYAFEIEDADIFFGREAASDELLQTVLKDRLSVLHAKSGAGKTSLLNAGLSPRLIRDGRLPVYVRAYEDPLIAIKRAIAPPSMGPWPELLNELTLQEFLGLACVRLGRKTKELVVILDQFEEFFIFWPERVHRQPFIDNLSDCYHDSSLPVRFIIALRKDYYSDLAELLEYIPNLFHNEYRLEKMSRHEAETAITRPASKLGTPVKYEPTLLDALLDDLNRGGMELPHLQIICTRLYQALKTDESILTLDSYKKLGKTKGLLSGYLNNVLDQFPDSRKTVAKEVLKALVSSETTKRVLRYKILAAQIATEKKELLDVLSELVDARLLRRDEITGEILYEMSHEYLIEQISKWIDQEDLVYKQAEELLTRELASWRVHGTMIPKERLELLQTQWSRLRDLDDDAYECALRSAVQAHLEIEHWARPDCPLAQNLLLNALGNWSGPIGRALIRDLGAIWEFREIYQLGSEDVATRKAAAKALAMIRDSRAVKPLTVTLKDEEISVRQTAVHSLGSIWNFPQLIRLGSVDESERVTAAEALGNLADSRAVEPLLSALLDKEEKVRWAATHALGLIWELTDLCNLVSENENIRKAAAKALGKLGDSRTVEPLVAALKDDKNTVRRNVINALGLIWELPEICKLQEIFKLVDKDAKESVTAAEILDEIGDSRAIEPLFALLEDDETDIRYGAVRSLENFGELAVDHLIKALRNDDIRVRISAAISLGNIGDSRAVEPLIEAYWAGHSHADVALAKIPDPRVLEVLLYDFFKQAATPISGPDFLDARRSFVESSAKHLDNFDLPHTLIPFIEVLRKREDYFWEEGLEVLEKIPPEAFKELKMPIVHEAIQMWREWAQRMPKY